GVFSLVLEGIPLNLAKEITQEISVPAIGIGAGKHCDGQILVINDLLGLNTSFKPLFVRRYAELEKEILDSLNNYSSDVKSQKFPSKKESYK
ncbi:MAG: 3-methyl-2-oxobutanoate hydroxymethyltransferase, partial [Elusimicrobiota bacterium]